MAELKFLENYSGQSINELLAMAQDYRVDSLVLAVEAALLLKRNVNDIEQKILAVEALEREVNNGGYAQFLINSSHEFLPIIVNALNSIGCGQTAKITQKAIDVLGTSEALDPDAIEVMLVNNPELTQQLDECDRLYYENFEPIADYLFQFMQVNKDKIRLID